MERTIYAVFPRTLIETWALFSIRSTLDVAIWRKCSASYALGASSISTKHYTDMSMLLHDVIQHGIDGAHRQWCTLPYTMGSSRSISADLPISYCFHVKVSSAIGRQVSPVIPEVSRRCDVTPEVETVYRVCIEC